MVKTTLVTLLLFALPVLLAVPVMADTPKTEKPATSPSPTTWYKGFVKEKDISSFTIKTGEIVIKINIDKDTRFFKSEEPDRTTITRTKTVETLTTTTNKAKDTGTKQSSPEATITATIKGDQPGNNERAKSATTKSITPSGYGTEATFNNLVIGNTVAVQTDKDLKIMLAKVVVIAASSTTETKVAPVKLSVNGKIVSLDEAKMTFIVKPDSGGDTMIFKYDSQTSFTIMGSASLKTGMKVEIVYLAEGNLLTARVVKGGLNITSNANGK
jgi:hypothetical protein